MRNFTNLFALLTCCCLLVLSTNVYAQPANDECVDAIDVSALFDGACGVTNTSMAFAMQDAAGNPATPGADDPVEPDCFVDDATATETSVWFTFTVPDLNGDGSDVTYAINTTVDGLANPLGGDADTELVLYDGSAGCPTAATGAADYVACSEDLFGVAPWISGFEVDLTPGNVYYMMIDTWDGVTVNAAGDAPGEFAFDVVPCGNVCGDAVCGLTETYCACAADCACDMITLAYVNIDFYFATDCTPAPTVVDGNFMIQQFGYGNPDNFYVWYGIIAGTDCSGYTIPGVNITYDNGNLFDVDATPIAIPSGDFAPELALLYFELTPAEYAQGTISVTATVDDGTGTGTLCTSDALVDFSGCPVQGPSCLAGNLDTAYDQQTVCTDGIICVATDGAEDLTLIECAEGYVYAYSIWGDPYATGAGTAQLSNWIIDVAGGACIDANTIMVDDSGYYYPPGALPTGTYYLNGASLCIDASGAITGGCFAGNELVINWDTDNTNPDCNTICCFNAPCEAAAGILELPDGSDQMSLCTNDGVDEPADVQVVDAGAGMSGAWVITDSYGIILDLPAGGPPFTLDGAGVGTCLIWWLTWDGDLIVPPAVGDDAAAIVADSDCAFLSNPITVVREECPLCEAAAGVLELPSGMTSMSICTNDGIDEPVDVQVVDAGAGMSGAWVITDPDGTILGLPDAPPFVIDGAGVGVCSIWWLTWDGDLSQAPAVGGDAVAIVTNSDCAFLSNPIVVTREECPVDCEGTVNGTVGEGDACDDGDPTTQGDVYDADCNCVGDAVPGCTDAAACNFDANATVDDGSCLANDCAGECGGAATAGTPCDDGDPATTGDAYDADCNCVGDAIPGCTDAAACNFDMDATVDDGSCLALDCNGDCGGAAVEGSACDDGDDATINDVLGADCSCAGETVLGCTDASACNYDADATEDDGSCDFVSCADCAGTPNGDALPGTPCDDGDDTTDGDTYSADCECVGDVTPGCTDEMACNYDPAATLNDGSCDFDSCAGCTDSDALNFDIDATIDDGSCTYYCNSAPGTIAFTFGGEYGNMSYICYGNDVVVDADDFLLVPGQSVYYVFHTDGPNASAPIQNPIQLGSFLTNNMGKMTVWVTAFGATNDGAGGPNYNDPCLTQSMNLEIQLLDPISIIYEDECDTDVGEFFYTFSVTGGLPECLPGATYNITGDYWDGVVGHLDAQSVGPISDAENFSISASDGNGCSGSDNYDVNCTKLPIELASLVGQATPAGNLVKWVTASEIENDYFILESSQDGVSFASIATVNGNGTSSLVNSYEHLDRDAQNGVTYYRLSQTDFDGTSETVGIVSVQRGEDIFGITDIYPVPATTVVNIDYTSMIDVNVVVEVYDVIGRMVESIEIPAIAGINQLGLDVEAYTEGIYFVSIIAGDTVSTQKFIVE